MNSFANFNLAAHYDITKHWRVFGRVENLFDEDYEEIDGYGTPGIAAYVGTRLTF